MMVVMMRMVVMDGGRGRKGGGVRVSRAGGE
jgi:hypothetical protein